MASPIQPPVKLSEWDHHQYKGLEYVKDGDNISGESCLVAAGPPLLSMTGGVWANTSSDLTNIDLADSTAYPLGLAQGFSIGQRRQQVRTYELGSRFDYLFTGKAVGQVTISKIFHSSGNLLRFLYAYYGTSGVVNIPALFSSPIAASGALNDVYIKPGNEVFFLNFFSDLFKNPIGLMFVLVTNQNNYVGAFYLERCMVHDYSIGFDAQGVVVQENSTVSFGNIKPIKLQMPSLLDAASNQFSDYFGT